MELTGKAGKDFNKWLSENFEPEEQPITVHASYEGELEVYASDNFYILPFSMRYGVYVDFFDSKDMVIDLPPVQEPTMGGTKTDGFKVYIKGFKYSHNILSRLAARVKAVEKANEIYNSTK